MNFSASESQPGIERQTRGHARRPVTDGDLADVACGGPTQTITSPPWGWALEDYVARSDEPARWTIRFIVALLHEKAGRTDSAVAELRALNEQLPKSNTMRQSADAALARLAPAAPRNRRE